MGALVPFGVQLNATVSMVDFHERFLSSGLTFLPVLLGTGWVVACREPLPMEAPRLLRRLARPWLRPVVTLLVLGLLVCGAIPSWLGPTARWRHRFTGDKQARQMEGEALQWTNTPGMGACYQRLQDDRLRDDQAGYHLYW
jgi:hypothetical protein